jgi:nicotinate-nucleotide pyrophosphorylase (carboxylating)
MLTKEELKKIKPLIRMALAEDIGDGDITTQFTISPDNIQGNALIIAKEEGILAGIDVAEMVFKMVDPRLEITKLVKDNTVLSPESPFMQIEGYVRGIITAERTALNFLQRLSGIATETKKYVDLMRKGKYKAKIFDTRKTIPGWRLLDKYAVRIGGGTNHRMGLYDMILLKDNHLKGKTPKTMRIKNLIQMTKSSIPPARQNKIKIEVEVNTIEEVKAALETHTDIIMLDNMSLTEISRAVKFVRSRNGHVLLEASGNITLENITVIAQTGVDIISVGALTHSVKALDMSLKLC